MRAVICGANGAMGKLIQERLTGNIAGLVSLDGENGVPKTFTELGFVNADVIVDFSHHSAVQDVLSYAKANHCAAVIGTTGHTEEEKAAIIDAAKAAYLATLIETGGENVERFTDAQLLGDLLIKPVLTSKLNKLRIGLPEAYFYWAKTSQLMK